MDYALQIEGVGKRYGDFTLDDVSFTLPRGYVMGLIGPNGAGKTTLFNVIAGAMPASGGEVRLGSRRLTGLRPDQICRAGVGRTFQLVKPFRELSVRDNVVVGALRMHRRVDEARAKADDILLTIGLHAKRHLPAGALTLPERKQLEVARALALDPKVLLLDEPLAGLNSVEAARLADTVAGINREGLTVVMIEHNLGEVLRVGQRLAVLDNGCKIADGNPLDVMKNPAVRTAYVGKERPHAAA